MSRIDRRNWLNPDMNTSFLGGIFDYADRVIKSTYRINDDEYNHLCGVMTNEEMDIFLTERPTFSQKRKMINLLNKHIKYE